jgi:hypothetical protein
MRQLHIAVGKESAMMTAEDAKRAVEAELHSRNLTKPMTLVEMTDFCQEMYKHLGSKSDSTRLADIRKAVYALAPLGRLAPTR